LAPRQLLERAELRQEPPRHVEGAHPPDARAELYRQELGVGQGRCAFVIQALSGPLLGRPLRDPKLTRHAVLVARGSPRDQCPLSQTPPRTSAGPASSIRRGSPPHPALGTRMRGGGS